MRKKLLLSMLDQGVVSTFNFLINFYLIRYWAPEGYGLFSVVLAIALFLTAIQNALVSTPLMVHLPTVRSSIERTHIRTIYTLANFILALCVLFLSFLSLICWLGLSKFALITLISLYLTLQFVREFYRSSLSVDGEFVKLLIMDLAYVTFVAIAIIVIGWNWGHKYLDVNLLFMVLNFCMGVTLICAAKTLKFICISNLYNEIKGLFMWQMHEIKWSLLGVITTEIQNRGYVYITAVFFGASAVALLQAGRVFFGPLNLITTAWARVARPLLSGLVARGDVKSVDVELRKAILLFTLINITFILALWFGWAPLSKLIFNDKYNGIGLIVVGWGLVNFIFQIRSCLSVGVQALRAFRALTFATVYGALISCVIILVGCVVNQPLFMIVAVMVGELFALIFIINLLNKYRKKVSF